MSETCIEGGIQHTKRVVEERLIIAPRRDRVCVCATQSNGLVGFSTIHVELSLDELEHFCREGLRIAEECRKRPAPEAREVA